MRPHGWNSWASAGPGVDEHHVLAAAAALVETGLRDAGYRYVVIDDGWSAPERDRDGRLVPDPQRFPTPMPELAARLHRAGLRLGLYASATTSTCAQRRGTVTGCTGSWGHERTDAATFASWGVDLVKHDWCSPWGDLTDQRAAFTRMSDALPDGVVLCINPNSHHAGLHGFGHDWDDVADWWRTTENVAPIWRRTGSDPQDPVGVLDVLDTHLARSARGLARGVVDADHLPIGHHGDARQSLSAEQSRTAIGMWGLLGAPMVLACDPRDVGAAGLALLTDPVLASPVASSGRPAGVVHRDGGLEIWERAVGERAVLVGLLNRTGHPRDVAADEAAEIVTRAGLDRARMVGATEASADSARRLARGRLPAHGLRLLHGQTW